ncbi:rRNA maturation RNase YbeY [Winogradskyella wandonensis]|uniref:Endoribonuclease YbeY n=1 Tax=Winogradskyella wandonensis TaxID=1442586 RepID=A0A4R1KTF9_9FLAO|nr:rRNA maturation RNase YbeY [Winogradskyella wandonensis]TCK67830.1 rRNA maturation RNase YbeY [Winogradskyella wandonensis]
MISFNYEIDFKLEDEQRKREWIARLIQEENCSEGEINYIFCSDVYLHKINVQFLNHDTLTDIISFDYSVGKELHGDIYISIDRVRDNAKDFKTTFKQELSRVMAHGVLHYCGYKDKTKSDQELMTLKEDYYLSKCI